MVGGREPQPDAGDLPPHIAEQRVRQSWHPGRWVATFVALVLFAMFVNALVTNPFFQWSVFAHWFFQPVIIDGLKLTLILTGLGAVIGLAGGTILAVMRLSKSPLLQLLSFLYTWIFRSIPLIVLLLFLANTAALYPQLSLGIPFGPEFYHFDANQVMTYFTVALIGVSLNEAAYASELVRAGVLSIDQGQTEAAAALGLSKRRQYWRIIFPQAVRSIIPNFANQLINMLKGTAVVYIASLTDLFGAVQMQASINSGQIVPLLMVATVWYIILTSALAVLQYYLERYYSKGAVREMPPTPAQRLTRKVKSMLAQSTEVAR